MADNDNKELMQFLEKKFDGIEKRFDGIEKQFDGIEKQFEGINKRLDNTATKDDLKAEIAASKEEVMRHTGVLIEEVNHKLDLLVEGRTATHERIEKDKEENEQEHRRLEKMSLINTADISKLDQRVIRLEGSI